VGRRHRANAESKIDCFKLRLNARRPGGLASGMSAPIHNSATIEASPLLGSILACHRMPKDAPEVMERLSSPISSVVSAIPSQALRWPFARSGCMVLNWPNVRRQRDG
jgi:hypothetical protein